jgi:CheY-like chemotaxis protein
MLIVANLGPTFEARAPTILVVDDEVDIREGVQRLLQTSLRGARVLVAGSGMEGVSLLEREPVDLIVTDYRMPGMNGLEFLERAQALKPKVLRILVTAFERELLEEAGRYHGAPVFPKPIDPRSLVDFCRRVLRV